MEDIKESTKKWQTIYPIYLNSKVTIEGGRRVPKEKGIENPTCEEIAEVLSYLKLAHAVEVDKAYPRDWMQKGRIKVLLKDAHGQLFHPEITNSMLLKPLTTRDNTKNREEADAKAV